MFLTRLQSCLLMFCAAAGASAQTASPPPIKMGLWETTVTSQMSGMPQLPPDMVAKLQQMGKPIPGAPHTIVTQSCLTQEQWEKDFEQINKPRNSDCTMQKGPSDTHDFTFDISCKTDRGMTMNGHWEIHFVDDEHSHGSGSMKADQAMPNGQPFAMQMTIDAHYAGADCGDVVPGTPKIIKQ